MRKGKNYGGKKLIFKWIYVKNALTKVKNSNHDL